MTGECQTERNDDDAGTSICYASGVTENAQPARGKCGVDRFLTYETAAYASDGSLCLRAETAVDCTMALEGGRTVWTNAKGETIAVLEFRYDSGMITCAATGEENTCTGIGCGRPRA